MFDNNFDKVERFSKFFYQLICEKIAYVQTQRLPPHLRRVATLPCESRKSKNVRPIGLVILTASSTNC